MAPTNAELVERNKQYVFTHQAMPTISEIEAMGGGAPKTAIITCVDPRVFPEKLLALRLGEAFIFRTVAGHPQAALNDLAALDIETDGGVEDVMIIYHTDCGSLRFNIEKIRKGWKQRDPKAEQSVETSTFGAVQPDAVDEAIRRDVEWMKSQPLMREGKGIHVGGYLFDIKTGELRQVV